jgi:hypothetical protein
MFNRETVYESRVTSLKSTAAVLLAGVAFSGCGWEASDPTSLPSDAEYVGVREEIIGKKWHPGPSYREALGDVRVWLTSWRGFSNTECAEDERLDYDPAPNEPGWIEGNGIPNLVYVWCRPDDDGEKFF